MPLQSAGAVWALPRFRRYFAARTISLLGDSMVPVALTAAVLHEGYGAAGVGLVLAAPLVPWVVLMLFAGLWADRIGPVPMMLTADALRLVGQAVLAAAFATGHASLWLIVAMQAVSGVGTSLFQPGVGSVVTRITGNVQQANGVLRTSEAIVTMLGPAVAGLALAMVGTDAVISLDAASFGLSALLLLAMRLPGGPVAATGTGTGTGMIADLKEGWREFSSRRWLWVVITVFCVFGLTVFGPFYILSSAQVTERHGPAALGAVLAVEGIGAAIGGIVATRVRPARPLTTAVCYLLLIIPQFLVLAADPSVVAIAAAIGVGAFGRSVWSVLWNTTEQTHVPAGALNRVYAYDVVGSVLLLPVGRALTGPLSGWTGAGPALVAAAAIVAVGCAVMLGTPELRRLGARPAGGAAQPVAVGGPAG
ncbi:MFS family permease [Kitasatospora sp. GP30]|uniref:MFS transporter n=1 Tax=Kitasatospora sp. GP30 TaxID=3035084 RepID=UPI000C701531|nr:MFS transporter [Kitasatospora sp. GP30]MDH6139342.1 MFS family permease [Kitasatospora sp. GP30]